MGSGFLDQNGRKVMYGSLVQCTDVDDRLGLVVGIDSMGLAVVTWRPGDNVDVVRISDLAVVTVGDVPVNFCTAVDVVWAKRIWDMALSRMRPQDPIKPN